MKRVRNLCGDVRAHRHLKGGLSGLVWDYLSDRWVWRTSLAAEYPCGLCFSWAQSLKAWLESDEGSAWIRQHTLIKAGKSSNALLRGGKLKAEITKATTHSLSTKQSRDDENKKAIGGLRDAGKAAALSARYRDVGDMIREVIDGAFDSQVVEAFENNVQAGVPESWIRSVRAALCGAFGASAGESPGYQVQLWQKILQKAGDCEANILPRWLSSGFPLGIKGDIEHSGAFPPTSEDTGAVEASRAIGKWMDDFDGGATNYVSFKEEAAGAQSLLDEMIELDRATVVHILGMK